MDNYATKTYKIGFAHSALVNESIILAREFCETSDWTRAKDAIVARNLFQTRAERTGIIIFDELKKRLSYLNYDQLQLLADDSSADAKQLTWIGLCQRYAFIGDFMLEVVSSKYRAGMFEITDEDYRHFFNAKAESHPELDAVSDKTRTNAHAAVFQMLRQCDLLNQGNQVIPQMISSALQNCSSRSDLRFIPGAIYL